MTSKEKEALRNISLNELEEKAELLRRELFSTRLRSKTSPMSNNQQLKRLKKDIARILTIISEKKAFNS